MESSKQDKEGCQTHPNVAYVRWKRVPDPDKPELPYRPGFRLSIRRHVPIPPFGHYYTHKLAPLSEYEKHVQRQMPLSQWCLMFPPMPSPPHPDPTVSDLQIIDHIACKNGRGAQLVRCRLDSDPERILVAKIYDAFYYDAGRGAPNDTPQKADFDYSREAGAYEVLRDAKVDGQIVPKYYGSWTFDLPVPEAIRLLGYPDTKDPFPPTRPVRMVLYEWIDGVSIYELLKDEELVKSIPQEVRLEVLAKSMEGLCMVEHLGVRHNDWAPRNVLVSPAPAAGWTMSSLPAVYLIDFNGADLTRSPDYLRDRYRPESLPLSPRYRFFYGCRAYFRKWIPSGYKDGKAFNGWLSIRWEEDDERFYRIPPESKEYYNNAENFAYVSLGPESPLGCPSYYSSDNEYYED